MRLNRQSVGRLKLPPGKADVIYFDDALPGFGLRIRAGGKQVWIAQYRVGAKQRRVTIGPLRTVDPDDARRRAKEILAQAHLGGDPQAAKAQARTRCVTLLDVGELYIERYARGRLKPKTLSDLTRYLRVSWHPLHELDIMKVDRRQVALTMGDIVEESGPTAANRARAALSGLFSWAMREGLADTNPVVGTNRPAAEQSRDRVLTDQELAAIWEACGASDYGRIVRLLMLTGQRREEVGGMAWSELELPTSTWRVPRERTKNGRPHEVPLSQAAMDLISDTPRRLGRDLLFGEAGGPFQGWSKAKRTLDSRLRAHDCVVVAWRLHDLRRTVATRLADLGVQPHVIEAVLNHVSGHRAGVAGVYNRSLYSSEKRAALELWGQYLNPQTHRSSR